MNISIGSDHAGLALKATLSSALREQGHSVEDLGTITGQSVDYPDIAALVARSVADQATQFGVLVCGSGIGMAMAANKISGIRAAVIHDVTSARLSRLHNDANIFCVGERLIGPAVATEALEVWVTTEFEGGRHADRIAKIANLEGKNQ